MNLTKQDWKKLRLPILTFFVSLLLAGLLVNWADGYRNENAEALRLEQTHYNQARQKFQQSGQEKQTIEQYLPIYNKMLSEGFIGEERRIEWIEKLRQVHSEHKLFSIDYQIGKQENYKPNFIPDIGNFVLHRSVMKISLGMLHEGDLLNLLDGLYEQTTPFIVRECEIVRPSGLPINTKALATNLKADCQIDWLTLRDPQLGGIAK
jgi:hypothetical protein